MQTYLHDLADDLGGEREITLGMTDGGLCAAALRLGATLLRHGPEGAGPAFAEFARCAREAADGYAPERPAVRAA